MTTFIPDMVATHPRRSAGGSPRTLTTTSSSGGGLRLVIGNRRLMLEQQVSVGVEAQGFMQEHEAQARTCVLVGINGEVVAALAIADPLKPEAKAVVAALHAQVGRGWGHWWTAPISGLFLMFFTVLYVNLPLEVQANAGLGQQALLHTAACS